MPVGKHLLTAHTCFYSLWTHHLYWLQVPALVRIQSLVTLHSLQAQALFHRLLFGLLRIHKTTPVDLQGLWPVWVGALTVSDPWLAEILSFWCTPSLYKHAAADKRFMMVKQLGLWCLSHRSEYAAVSTDNQDQTLQLKGTLTCHELNPWLNACRNHSWWAGERPS